MLFLCPIIKKTSI